MCVDWRSHNVYQSEYKMNNDSWRVLYTGNEFYILSENCGSHSYLEMSFSSTCFNLTSWVLNSPLLYLCLLRITLFFVFYPHISYTVLFLIYYNRFDRSSVGWWVQKWCVEYERDRLDRSGRQRNKKQLQTKTAKDNITIKMDPTYPWKNTATRPDL